MAQPLLVQPRLIQPMVLQQPMILQQPLENELATNKKQKTDQNEIGGSIRKKTRNKRINILKKRTTIKKRKRRKTKKQKKIIKLK